MDKNLYIGFNNITNHDFSISILYKGKIFAIELERITREKNFPIKWSNLISEDWGALNGISETDNKDLLLLKKYLNLSINEIVKKIVGNFQDIDKAYVINSPFNIKIKGLEKKTKSYQYIYHHLFHASSAYYPSSFDESAILSIDQSGEDTSINGGNTVMHTIWYARGNNIHNLYYDQYSHRAKKLGIGSNYSIHSSICKIGEGSMMGLASYGKDKFKNIKILDYNNGININTKFLKGAESIISNNNIFEDKSAIYKVVEKNIYNTYSKTQNNKFDKIENSIYADIAYHVQKETEEAIIYLANKAYELTGSKNICLAGGVALNILANTKILEKTPFENIFVQPACTDAGLSLGALYYMYNNILGNKKRIRLDSPGLGFDYSNDKILSSLEKYKDKLTYIKLGKEKYNIGAQILSQDKIIGWFQGKSEFGPRALGFRSILASPISSKMKNRLNNIKNRENFRPIAPIMMEDYFTDYIETDYPSPYMTLAAKVKKEKLNKIPAVVHVDGSTRYQTVNEKQNKEVYNLLKEFHKLTGVAVLTNTSFNQGGEPIVEKPDDAIKMFLATGLDFLIIGDYLVSKNKIYKEFIFGSIDLVKSM